MKQTLTPGRWRGLKTTSTPNHIFTILAFDQRGAYRKMLPEGTSYVEAAQIKQDIVRPLSFHASAVLLDAEYSLNAVLTMAGSSGLLMALEKSGYSGDTTNRRTIFIDGWSVAKIKQVGASAVKLLTYYHPDSGALATETETLIQHIAQECHDHDLPLFLEPLSYSLDATASKETFAKDRPRVVVEIARRLSKLGPDVMKMEFPLDVEFEKDRSVWQHQCEAISANCVAPWVLLSAGVDFDTFAEQTRIACKAGASGFLAGRAIWKEGVTMTQAARQDFVDKVAVPRLNQLADVASKEARPWSDFYAPIEAVENWYTSYATSLT